MAKSTGVGKIVSDSGLDMLSPKHSFLSTFLLKERRNPDSIWRPYLDMLPGDYNSFPVFFSNEDMKWLEGSPFAGNIFCILNLFITLLEQVKDKKADLKKDYDAIICVSESICMCNIIH